VTHLYSLCLKFETNIIDKHFMTNSEIKKRLPNQTFDIEYSYVI